MLYKPNQLRNSAILGFEPRLVRAEPWAQETRQFVVNNSFHGLADDREQSYGSVVAWRRAAAFLVDRDYHSVFPSGREGGIGKASVEEGR